MDGWSIALRHSGCINLILMAVVVMVAWGEVPKWRYRVWLRLALWIMAMLMLTGAFYIGGIWS